MNSKNWMLRHAVACCGMLPNPYVQLQKMGAAACCGCTCLEWALPFVPSYYWEWCAGDASPLKKYFSQLPPRCRRGDKWGGMPSELSRGVRDDRLSMSFSDHGFGNRPSSSGAGMEVGPSRLA